MATWDDVRRITAELPETSEATSYGDPSWKVRGKNYVWDRPLRKTEAEQLGEPAPDGAIVAVYVQDEGVKSALIADDPDVMFTTPHFDGYPIVLILLDRVAVPVLDELITESWLLRAPKKVARGYLDGLTRP